MSLPEAIARPLIAGIFVYGGIDSLRTATKKAKTAEPVTAAVSDATGLGSAELVTINGAVQVGAGVALALGILPRPAAALLAVSLVPTTLAGHRFWEEHDPQRRGGQTIQFLKNVGLLGGLVLAATSTGGRPSLPWRARRTVSHGLESARGTLGELRHAFLTLR